MNSFCRLFIVQLSLCNRHIRKFPVMNIHHRHYYTTHRLHTAADEVVDQERDEFEDQPSFPIDPRLIVGDDVKKIEDMKNLMLEIELLTQMPGNLIPKSLTPKEWNLLLSAKTSAARSSLLESIYVNRQQLNDFQQKVTRKKELRGPPPDISTLKLTTSSLPMYRLGVTTLFHRITDHMLNRLRNFKLARAAMFGTDVFIDCSYEEYMNSAEKMHCAHQLLYSYSNNRDALEPFNLILCNADKEGAVLQKFHELVPNLYDDSFVTVTEKSFTDFYQKEKFIYLTPDCYEDLETYDHDSYYIIGAYVDEVRNFQMSLAKAKEQGLRMARLPIDKYVNWCQGSKLLPFNQCVDILNDLKQGACWSYAFRHIAPRKQGFRNFDNDIRGKTLKQKDLSRLIYNNIKKEMRYNNKIQLKTAKNMSVEE